MTFISSYVVQYCTYVRIKLKNKKHLFFDVREVFELRTPVPYGTLLCITSITFWV